MKQNIKNIIFICFSVIAFSILSTITVEAATTTPTYKNRMEAWNVLEKRILSVLKGEMPDKVTIANRDGKYVYYIDIFNIKWTFFYNSGIV